MLRLIVLFKKAFSAGRKSFTYKGKKYLIPTLQTSGTMAQQRAYKDQALRKIDAKEFDIYTNPSGKKVIMFA